MKTILVPLDGSVLAEQVLPYVRLLASLLGAQVRLLHVSSDQDMAHLLVHDGALAHELGMQAPAGKTSAEQLRVLLRQQAVDYLAAHAAELRAAGIAAEAEVDDGYAPEQIIAVAEHGHTDLIAMATHGYGGLRRWAFGSVADRVAQATPCPIFVVRAAEQAPQAPAALKRILVPLDGSALAEQALPLATQLARQAQAELILLQAVIPVVEYAPGIAPFARPLPQAIRYPDTLYEQVRRQLAATLDRLAPGGLMVKPVVLVGYPAEAIIDEAVRRHADLIVMATHGYGGLRRWAFGSVADKVLQASSVPLLLVRSHDDMPERSN